MQPIPQKTTNAHTLGTTFPAKELCTTITAYSPGQYFSFAGTSYRSADFLFNYPYNDIDIIEGEGLFNFAKLSGSEI